MASKYQLRSISLPSRSHPSTIRVDEELIKLKTWEATSTSTSKSIAIGFSLLQDLYLSLDAFLNMASTQHVISQNQGGDEKYFEEVLDGSIRVLDICGITRDIILQIKENVQSLHSSLRRRKGDSSVEKSVLEYNLFTKKMKKNSKKVITNLKHMDSNFGVSPILNLGDHFGAVVRVLREVILMNLFVFQLLLSFFNMSKSKSKSKSTKWLMVAKLLHKGVIACDEDNSQNVNELQCVEASLSTLLIEGINNGEKMHIAHEKLGALENVLESLDNNLDSTFRNLIKTRASLLNMISVHHKIWLPFIMKRATMATFKHSSKYGVRSISLPTRSHPSTIQVEEELNKLKSWDSSSSSSSLSKVETICYGLLGLGKLYKCIEDLLKLPLTQQALGQHKDEKWVNEFLDCPLRFLDLLGKTRDSIMLMKSSVEDLQSSLRRRKIGNLDIEGHISSYWSLRRNIRKECTKNLLFLKQIDDGPFPPPPLDLDDDNHLCALVRVLRESSLITSSIFQSLFVFLSSSILKSKPTKWAFVSRLVHKGVLISCNNNQQENVNALEKVDLSLCNLELTIMENLNKEEVGERIQSTNRSLEALVLGIQGIEEGLECLFKHLINTRVSFLNIISP
ncbi:uncharacterized protein LOC107632443 [Arachis ipaensis]|nr:uncharacterized protein LOC107632443 [Arachis ipaensis]